MTPNNKQNLETSKQKVKTYAKYSSIAIQMAVVVVGGTFGGLKLDQYFKNDFPIFILIFSTLSVVLAIYLVIKDLIRNKS